ncbi:MAG: outer membrane beta-barrel protein [Pseudomonadota bacterium]
MRIAIATTAAALLAAAPSFAQEVVPLEPGPVLSTQGAFGGGFRSGNRASYDWSGYYIGAAIGYADVDPGSLSDDEDIIGGFRLGYDADLGNFVLGGRADYDFTGLDLGSEGEIEGILRLGARLGYDAGRSLIYGIGGYAETVSDGVEDGEGFFVGGGYEVFVTDRVTVGAEALYHELDDFGTGIDAEVVTATVGVNFRF